MVLHPPKITLFIGMYFTDSWHNFLLEHFFRGSSGDSSIKQKWFSDSSGRQTFHCLLW